MDYSLLCKQLDGLLEDTENTVSKLSNAAALLYHSLEDVSWAGFYLTEGDRLVLGPFQGKPACTVISFGKGVCGTAAAEKKTQLVENVHLFSGHIACDSASNSEIVVPIFKEGEVFGVLDIDSTSLSRFTVQDKEGLEAAVKIIEANL